MYPWVITEAGSAVDPLHVARPIDDGGARQVGVVAGDLALAAVGDEGPQPASPGSQVEEVSDE